MTTHTWGEDPRGKWILQVKFQGEDGDAGAVHQSGVLKEWTLMLHGTRDPPYVSIVIKLLVA